MSTLQERLKNDLKEAMKKKEIVKRDTIRFLNSAIKQVEVDERRSLSDNDIIMIIQKSLKQREDSISQFKKANRNDLVEKEQAQASILKQYLPKQLTLEELEIEIKKIIKEVEATSLKDIKKIMPVAISRLSTVTDGKKINECVRKILGQ